MTMKSGNHTKGVRRDDGTWSCSACGAESANFELFEEAGDFEKCIAKFSIGGENVKLKRDIERASFQARNHVNLNAAIESMGEFKRGMDSFVQAFNKGGMLK